MLARVLDTLTLSALAESLARDASRFAHEGCEVRLVLLHGARGDVRPLRVCETRAEHCGPPGGTADDGGPGGLVGLHLELRASLQGSDGPRIAVGEPAERRDGLRRSVLLEPPDVPLGFGLGDRARATGPQSKGQRHRRTNPA